MKGIVLFLFVNIMMLCGKGSLYWDMCVGHLFGRLNWVRIRNESENESMGLYSFSAVSKMSVISVSWVSADASVCIDVKNGTGGLFLFCVSRMNCFVICIA